jgi:hypothetical protein
MLTFPQSQQETGAEFTEVNPPTFTTDPLFPIRIPLIIANFL